MNGIAVSFLALYGSVSSLIENMKKTLGSKLLLPLLPWELGVGSKPRSLRRSPHRVRVSPGSGRYMPTAERPLPRTCPAGHRSTVDRSTVRQVGGHTWRSMAWSEAPSGRAPAAALAKTVRDRTKTEPKWQQ